MGSYQPHPADSARRVVLYSKIVLYSQQDPARSIRNVSFHEASPWSRFVHGETERVYSIKWEEDVMQKNKIESRRVRKMVRARSKKCYLNAMRVISDVPGYQEADYVEGYAVIPGRICIEHGWVERDGEITDPTLPDADITYFPGLRFKGNLGIAKALQIPKEDWCKDLPIFHRFGWGGIESPEFRSAIVAAYRYVGMEDTAKRYEEWEETRVEETVD